MSIHIDTILSRFPTYNTGQQSMMYSLFLLILCSSCFSLCEGEDSWGHYVNGGIYETNSGSMSPSGDRIVMSLPRTGHGDIYQVSCLTKQITRLTTSERFEASPVFSPSGRKVYYVSELQGSRHVWVMNSDGASQSQLTSGQVLDDIVDVSCNDHYILVERSHESGGLGRIASAYLVDCRTPGVDAIKVGRYARFTSNGLTIVYVPSEKTEEVWELDLKTKKCEYIGIGTLPIPSADGKRIAIIRPSEQSQWQRDYNIWIIDRCRKKEFRVGVGHSMCFLPDGSGLLYYQGYECKVQLYSFKENRVHEVNSPIGYKSPPMACLDGSGCLIRIVTQNDRVGSYYYYRTSTGKLEQFVDGTEKACP